MGKLKIGDSVELKLKGTNIINPYDENYDSVQTLNIIYIDKYGEYMVYVPHYIIITGTTKLDQFDSKKLNIPNKYVGEQIIRINGNQIHKANVLDGCYCGMCGKFYYQATVNQWTGAFVCWACQNDAV